jgi:hypothetical protein
MSRRTFRNFQIAGITVGKDELSAIVGRFTGDSFIKRLVLAEFRPMF